MKEYKINYKTSVENLESINFHALTKNGPYFDAHFGPLTSKTPVGQTYFIRSYTEYYPSCKNNLKNGCGCGGKNGGIIKFTLKDCFPAVHANSNTVSDKFRITGTVKIHPFEWNGNIAKVIPNQVVEVDLVVKNLTNLAMQGFHIHDGQNKNGLTSFGPISYFLYTTPEWQKVYNSSKKSQDFAKKNAPLPPNNIALKNNKYLLKQSNNIKIHNKTMKNKK